MKVAYFPTLTHRPAGSCCDHHHGPQFVTTNNTADGLFVIHFISDEEQVSCKRARTIWKLSTPGPDTVKQAAEAYFNRAWKAKFHKVITD